MPLETAFIIGVLAFVPGDIIKVIIAAFLARKLNKEGGAGQ
jgi:biotin transporter BioY